MTTEIEPQVNYEDKVRDLGSGIDRLKSLYDNFFLGRERVPPNIQRQDVDRKLQFLLNNLVHIQNTALRFQINSMKSKLSSFRRHWDRTIQQIEEGTYKRDRFRLKLSQQNKSEEETADDSKKKATSPKKTPSGEKNPAIEALMRQYVSAKKKCNEPVKGISYEAFAKTITKQSSALKKRFQGKKVRFKVVIEDGKTKLKATPV